MLDNIDLSPRRYQRFFGAGGICERYEQCGDHLVQFCEIADWLINAVPGLSRDAVERLFVLSARNHWFGRHGPRQTIERLIDLDDITAPRRMYSLRPSGLRVEAAPELMRAPSSARR